MRELSSRAEGPWARVKYRIEIVIAGVACVLAWAMEISRRRSQRINEAILRVLSPIAHPHEVRRVNSATWYTTALAIMANRK